MNVLKEIPAREQEHSIVYVRGDYVENYREWLERMHERNNILH